MASGKQILAQYSTHKGSVRFDKKSKEDHPLFASVYLMRDAAKKFLGVKDLDKTDEIEITVRVVSGKSKKDASDEEDEEDD